MYFNVHYFPLPIVPWLWLLIHRKQQPGNTERQVLFLHIPIASFLSSNAVLLTWSTDRRSCCEMGAIDGRRRSLPHLDVTSGRCDALILELRSAPEPKRCEYLTGLITESSWVNSKGASQPLIAEIRQHSHQAVLVVLYSTFSATELAG